MKLIEWDGVRLLKGLGIMSPQGLLLPFDASSWPADQTWPGPQYVKAQVLQGRRGKRGLIRRCDSPEEVAQFLADMQKQLTSKNCAGFVCVPEQPHTQEWFIACDLDRASGRVRFHLGSEGGKDVADTQTWLMDEDGAQNIPAEFVDLARTLAQGLSTLDALSIEINPLAQSPDGSFIALDAKIELDDAAAFRHPEWEEFSSLSRWGEIHSPREQAYTELLKENQAKTALLGKYVELDGDIAVVLAGGGASLAAMDSLVRHGGRPANYLEISGNPDPDFLKQAAKIVFSHPNIRAVWIVGSFANFTDIQLTVGAVLAALEESGLHIPVCIRRDGPRVAEAQKEALAWAERYGVPLQFSRADASFSDSARLLLESMH